MGASFAQPTHRPRLRVRLVRIARAATRSRSHQSHLFIYFDVCFHMSCSHGCEQHEHSRPQARVAAVLYGRIGALDLGEGRKFRTRDGVPASAPMIDLLAGDGEQPRARRTQPGPCAARSGTPCQQQTHRPGANGWLDTRALGHPPRAPGPEAVEVVVHRCGGGGRGLALLRNRGRRRPLRGVQPRRAGRQRAADRHGLQTGPRARLPEGRQARAA